MRQRPLLLAFIALIAVFVLIVVGLYLYLTPERLRGLVVSRVEEALGRRVHVDDIGLSLWGGPRASIQGLRIDDREGFGSVPFLAARSGSVSISLLSLLRGKPDLGRLRIEGPSVSVVVDENGEANYHDLIAALRNTRRKGMKNALMLPINRLDLVDGSIRRENRQTGVVTRFDGIDYGLDIGLDGGKLRLDGRLSIRDITRVDPIEGESSTHGLSLSHEIRLNPAAGEAVLESAHLRFGPFELGIQGRVRNYSDVPDLALEVRHDKEALSWSGPDGLAADGKISVSASVSGAFAPDAVPPAYPDIIASIDLTDLTVRTPDLRVPLEKGVLRIELAENLLRIEEFSAKAGRSDFFATGRVSGLADCVFAGGRPFLSFALRSNLIDLDEMLPARPTKPSAWFRLDGWSVTAAAHAAAPADGTSPMLMLVRALDADGSIAAKQVKRGWVLRDLNARVRAKDRRIALEDIATGLYGGALSGKIELDARRPHGLVPLQADLKLEGCSAGGLLQGLFRLPVPLHGDMGLVLNMTGAVDSTLTLIEKEISAEGDAGMAEGRIVNWTWLKDAASRFSQLSLVDFNDIPIKALKASFSVSNERLYVKQLTMAASGIPCRINGSAGLNGGLDCTLDMDLPAGRLNVGGINLGLALGVFFGNMGGSTIPVRIHFGGTADKPNVALDLQPVQQRREQTRQKGKTLLQRP